MTERTHQAGACCAEYTGISRRGLLKGLAAVAGGAVVTSAHGQVFAQTAYAATGTADAVLVVLSLRGGADGLSLVVPHGDPGYYAARPRIAVPAERLLARGEMFGLHPALGPLLPLWESGRLAAVHAAGLPAPNRSHFAAMEEVEDADPGSSARVGWLNRLIGLDAFRAPVQAVQIGDPMVPTALYGPEPVLATRSLADVDLAAPDDPTWRRRRVAALSTTWGSGGGALGAGARTAMRVVRDVRPAQQVSAAAHNGATYPSGDMGRAMAESARLIRADIGAEVVTVDFGGWDMHTYVGDLNGGRMLNQAAEMAQAVAAFFTDLGAIGDKVTLVTISEFGRRVDENANRGLDHGWGNAMLVAGAGVRGGGYYADWPGLDEQALRSGDLAVTTDYRSVLREVLRARFDADTSKVFPRFTGERVGVMLGQ
jgi:uncharacterized protein (DUF1501 family)